jgi:hypothetical protein
MTTPGNNPPDNVRDFDQAVDNLSQAMKAAGVHSTQVNPSPVRPQTWGCPTMCTTGRHWTPEVHPTEEELMAAKLVNRFKRWVRGTMGAPE